MRAAIGRMRATVGGRLSLVILTVALLFAGWSLAFRPYPTGGDCGSPFAVALSSPVDVPSPQRGTRDVKDRSAVDSHIRRQQAAGRLAPGGATRLERLKIATEQRFTKPERYTTNAVEISGAEIREERRSECFGQLQTAGFWGRAVAVPAIAAAALLAVRFVISPGRAGAA